MLIFCRHPTLAKSYPGTVGTYQVAPRPPGVPGVTSQLQYSICARKRQHAFLGNPFVLHCHIANLPFDRPYPKRVCRSTDTTRPKQGSLQLNKATNDHEMVHTRRPNPSHFNVASMFRATKRAAATPSSSVMLPPTWRLTGRERAGLLRVRVADHDCTR